MTTTTNFGWTLPTVGGDSDVWGTTLNTDLSAIDTLLGSGASGGTVSCNKLSLGGATIGTNALAVTGTSTFSDSITASKAGAIQIIAQSTTNSTYPTMYLKANNRSWWTSALDTGTDAPLAFGIGAVPGTNELMRLTPTGLLGIGMTPSNILDITQNQNASSTVNILNNSAGAAATSDLKVSNGTSVAVLRQNGATYTTSGAFRADGTLIYGTGAGGISIVTQPAQPIYFGTNNAEKMRLASGGALTINSTAAVYSEKLRVNGDVYVDGFTSGSYSRKQTSIRTGSSGTTYDLWRCTNGATGAGHTNVRMRMCIFNTDVQGNYASRTVEYMFHIGLTGGGSNTNWWNLSNQVDSVNAGVLAVDFSFSNVNSSGYFYCRIIPSVTGAAGASQTKFYYEVAALGDDANDLYLY
jgi:hypothetical protein